MMRVLIAGCGYVGTALGVELARAGHQVWGLRRNAEGLPDSIRPLSADLLDPSLGLRLPPVDHVVYAAAADGAQPQAYQAAYVDGVRNLQEALLAANAPVRRFVFTSSTAVYGDAGGAWVDEETPPEPEGFRGALVLEGETLVRSGPFRGIVLRLGGIYGPGRTRLLDRVRDGEVECEQGDPRWSNRIHREDAAGAAGHLLFLEDPAPIYVGVDDEPSDLCAVYRHLARRLGVPEPASAPAGGGNGASRRSRSNKRCSNARLRASGYRFRYPSFREGYGAMLAGG